VERLAVRWACVACLLVGLSSFAASVRVPPAPTQFVTDKANFISQATRLAEEQKLENYEKQTGHQLLVWIDRTTGDTPIEDWANAAFQAWRIGRKGIDDGLALFVFADDRKLRIEVGYGLEGVVPDATASRVIREVIVPRIRAGDNDGAIVAGMDRLISIIGGGNEAPAAPDYRRAPAPKEPSPLQIACCVFIALALLILFITHPTLATFLFSTMFSGRGGGGGWGDGGGGGGGGFSGGGGSSGGGGASGSW